MATNTSTKPPAGTRDFLPDEIRKRQYVIGVIRGVYEKYGFEPLETPAFENIETLLGKYGDEGNKLIFKILKRGEHEHTGEADLALRYDLTVPLARVVAQYQNELPKFFKRYQIQPVWRADRPAKGRFREFFQCDIDTIGSTSPVVEVEQLAAIADVMLGLGFQDFKIRLNHRLMLTALLEHAGIEPAQHGEVLVAIDKLDKIGMEGVIRELAARNVGSAQAQRLLASFTAPASRANVEELAAIVQLSESTSAGAHVQVDASLARGLSYYTGAIMEIAVPDLAGSLGGGGRYDNLIGMFLGRDVPACGFSLGLERVIVVMNERNMFPPGVAGGSVDVMVTMWEDAALRTEAIGLAADFRRAGLRAEAYPEPDKLGKQFKYAAERGTAFVAVQGETEVAAKTVSVKDLRTGEQFTLGKDEAAAFVRRHLGASDS